MLFLAKNVNKIVTDFKIEMRMRFKFYLINVSHNETKKLLGLKYLMAGGKTY